MGSKSINSVNCGKGLSKKISLFIGEARQKIHVEKKYKK
jgi:hypothetical protein